MNKIAGFPGVLEHGGGGKSRKSRKSRKTRSRKSRKSGGKRRAY
jgi:hypothetical protein